jgi:membrane associated rhomboid family serine protease
MVVPFHDVNPVRRTPWVMRLLIAANLVVFLLTPAVATLGVGAVSAAGLCDLQAFYYQYGAIPQELIENEQLGRVPTGGAADGESCEVGSPEYEKVPALSVLTSMFLHAGWLHLLGNMLFLFVFGNNVEERLGHLRFLLFYLAGGAIAAYGFALADPGSAVPMVGASGAVSAVLGAYLALWPRARVWSLVPVLFFIPLRLPAWLVLGLWFVLQYVYAAGYATSGAGGVAYLAHVLGFVFGFLVGLPLRRPRRRRRRGQPLPRRS